MADVEDVDLEGLVGISGGRFIAGGKDEDGDEEDKQGCEVADWF